MTDGGGGNRGFRGAGRALVEVLSGNRVRDEELRIKMAILEVGNN